MKMLTQPKIGSQWRHWKNGKIYTVVKFALFCYTDSWSRVAQECSLVIYEDAEGGSFARLEYEWHNTMSGGARRFTEVASPNE